MRSKYRVRPASSNRPLKVVDAFLQANHERDAVVAERRHLRQPARPGSPPTSVRYADRSRRTPSASSIRNLDALESKNATTTTNEIRNGPHGPPTT